jgi:cytochrome c-type biogenesis protein CcmH
MSRALVIAVALLVAGTARAIDTGVAFDDPALQARYEHIIDQVRCLKCQNTTIRDSNAFLAADLRREIRRMIAEGKTDDEIYDFLVDRYGEFALYSPRARGKTLVLWLAPGLLLLGGAVVLTGVLRRRMALPIDGEGGEGEGQS